MVRKTYNSVTTLPEESNDFTASGLDNAPSVILGAFEELSTFIFVLEHIPDNAYAARQAPEFSKIGEFVRHIVNFYEQFFKAIDAYEQDESETIRVDLENRDRDTGIDTDRMKAIRVLQMYQARMVELKKHDMKQRCYCFNRSAASRPPEEKGLDMDALIDYVLVFHVNHHIAPLIASLHTLGIKIDPRLSYAPSTAAHQNNPT